MVSLEELHSYFQTIHVYTAPVICIAGFLGNIVGSIVLIDLEMRAPISVFLTGLAISNAMTLVLYIPFSMLLLNFETKTGLQSAYAQVLMTTIAHIILNTSAISNWLTVTIAVYMLAILQRFFDLFKGITPSRAMKINIAVYVIVTLFCSYNYYSIVTITILPALNITLWNLGTGCCVDDPTIFESLNIFVHSVIMRLLPCVILTFVVLNVIREVHKAVRFSRQLPVADSNEASKWKSNRIHTLHISRMLLAVLIIFTLTESSNGVLMLLAHEYTSYYMIYTHLGDLLATLALINYGTTFLLYCFMSKQFRDACKAVGCHQAKQISLS